MAAPIDTVAGWQQHLRCMAADRELLELAAKAAGIDATWHHGCGKAIALLPSHPSGNLYWNPLADDGDAFRLAVQLGMMVQAPDARNRIASASVDNNVMDVTVTVDREIDAAAATRRAIVCAAAEVGRGMA